MRCSKIIKFNEEDVRRFYKWLDHWPTTEYTEIRIIGWPPGGPVIRRWVQTEDDFVAFCKKWSSKRQCYVGINPRSKEGGKKKDVSRIVAIPFDVDSGHPSKEAATDEEVEQAKQHMKALVSWIRVQGYETPLVAMSGNGFHVIQRVNLDIDDALPSKLEAYFHEAPTEDMDGIFDMPRIIKVPGTMSVKGVPTEERPHRLSYIVTEGSQSADKKLAEHIVQLEPYTAPIVTVSKETSKKRRTGSLRPCFKRFAEEGGRLTVLGSEDNLLRLALVTEAQQKGYSQAQILELFTKADDYDPAITKKAVNHQLGKNARDGLKPWSCKKIHKHGGCFGDACPRYKSQIGKHLPVVAPDPTQPTSPDDFFDARDKFIPNYLMTYIIQNTGEGYIKTPRTKKGGDRIWWYNPKTGTFTDDGESYIKGRIKQLLGDKARIHMIEEVLKLIKIDTYIDRKEFDDDPTVLVLQNGVYHLDTGELTEYSPHYHAKSNWPLIYDPEATCPATEKFLEEVIPGRVPVYLTWVGYHFFKDYRWAVILMLIGDGENGKDILLTHLRTFLGGEENVSSVNLYDLVTDKFEPSRLYGKVANIYSDIDQHELKYTGRLKAMTGNAWVGVQAKHMQGFDMRNYAKLNYSTNKMPKTPDSSRAFHRRWLVMNCPNFFVKDATPEMAAQNTYPCDSDIISKITTPAELSGFLNLALKGYHRLLEEGGFDLDSVDERQKIYDELQDPVAAFLNNCVNTTDVTGIIPKDQFYRFYFQFCKAKGYTPITTGTFTKQIKPQIISLGEARLMVPSSDKRQRCWTGISMSPDKTKPTCEKCPAYVACFSTKRMSRQEKAPTTVYPTLVEEELKQLEKEKNAPPPLDTTDIRESPDLEPQLVTASTLDAAIILLQNNGNKLTQDLFRRKLEFYGHAWSKEQEKILRGDPRLRFMGLNVLLMEDNDE